MRPRSGAGQAAARRTCAFLETLPYRSALGYGVTAQQGEGGDVSRVLLVGKGAPDRGGIPTFLNDLRTGDVGRTHEITFLNLAHDGTPQGGTVTVKNIVRTIRDAVSVWRTASDNQIVHIHSALAPTVTVIRAGILAGAARARGCSVVMHVHGGNIATWLALPARPLVLRLALAPVDRVVAVWSAGYDALVEVLGEHRVRLIENGVDTDRFGAAAATHSPPPRVLYVGLLTPRKGVLDLIAASQRLHDEDVDHELWLLGGTPDEGPAAAEPVLEAARGRATLLGTRPPEDMPDAYSAADVFCLPSWWEAMPMSVLEAMASGLPVVATDVGDVAHLVLDGSTGYVVPTQDPERLAAALRALLTDPERRRSMGAAGRARAEQHFSLRATARAVCDVYEQAKEPGA